MKLELLYLVFMLNLFNSQAFEVPEKLKSAARVLHKHCLEKTGADDKVLKQCAQSIIPDDPISKCYLHCVFDTVGMIDESGKIDLVTVAKSYYPELVEAAEMFHRDCEIPAHDDVCDMSWRAVKCYFDAHPDTIKYCHLFLF